MSQQTFTDGQVLTGAEMMNIPQGLLGASVNSSGQVISTTSSPGTAVTGMSISVTLASNRNVRLRAVVDGTFSTTTAIGSIAIFEGAGNLGQVNFSGGSDASHHGSAVVEVVLATGILGTSPSAGAHTYVVNMWVAGTGTFTFTTGATNSVFLCEDV